ncbi:MAG: glycine--tRNA ligase subunit beta [Thermodesulfobacteriota bacterium]|nr:glycine--tRNA ligase subunit beta [Thermodesulfobacteriota bacterium]
MTATCELIFEIGTEEIPSGYLENGVKALKDLMQSVLTENRIPVAGGIGAFGTPRRLILIGKGLSERQDDLVQEVTGPPKDIAYDVEGRPTKAAIGFARKQGLDVNQLECKKTEKGEYLAAKRHIQGRPCLEILAEALPRIIADISWPKSMRWGKEAFSFARPIHWILALLDGEVIPFEVAGIKSGNTSRGHRFTAPSLFEVTGIQQYLKEIEDRDVLIDQRQREKVVERITLEAANGVGGRPIEDPDLVKTVANLTEYPSAVCGGFDKQFLNLPDPVLLAAMREHQKYFAVYDHKDQLMPHFVAVNNTVAREESVVAKGHERVLRARLADADFFFKEDSKRSLEDRLKDLEGVIYQAGLGSSFAKVQRFSRLADWLAGTLVPDKLKDVKTVCRLCKCDLVTLMVMEFPSLQGAMGKQYARREGYPEEICQGIHEHYFPVGAEGQTPETDVGAVVGVADRMDTITGFFCIGLIPSGSADPFALRRHALSIIRIIEERGWDVSLLACIGQALTILREEIDFDRDQVCSQVVEFFKERYRQRMLRSGYGFDVVEAVISTQFDRIHQLPMKIEQLKRFVAESKEVESVAVTFKRVKNILKNQEEMLDVVPELFKTEWESTLWNTYHSLKDEVDRCLKNDEYYKALTLMPRIAKPVDDLFEGVEILTKEDQALRSNRVALLQRISSLFLGVADFSKVSLS